MKKFTKKQILWGMFALMIGIATIAYAARDRRFSATGDYSINGTTGTQIQTAGVDAITVDTSQNVTIPAGDLSVTNTNNITATSTTASGTEHKSVSAVTNTGATPEYSGISSGAGNHQPTLYTNSTLRIVQNTLADGSGTDTDMMTFDSNQDVVIPNGDFTVSGSNVFKADISTGFVNMKVEDNGADTGTCANSGTFCRGTWTSTTRDETNVSPTGQSVNEENYIRFGPSFIFSGQLVVTAITNPDFAFEINLPSVVDIPNANACSGSATGNSAFPFTCAIKGDSGDNELRFECITTDKSTIAGASSINFWAICRSQ